MANKIRGIVVEIGGDTTGLSKALKDVNSEIRGTQSQLKDVERLLKLDPKNTELLRQRFDLLNKSVNQTEEKLDALKQAEKKVQEQFVKGDASEEQYNALKREIIATEMELQGIRTRASEAEDALRHIDEKPVEEVAKAADEAEEELKEAGKEASNFGDYLKAEAIVEGAKSIVGSLKDVAEETKEYRKIMGSLEVSSESAGYTAEQTAQSYKQLYGVLGDEQSAATTTANLQALGLSQEQLTKLTNGTIGAWAKYGDSIPIDGLAEAINETVKAGQVTGTFADVLNWAGTSEDDFNEKLSEAGSEAERVNLIMQEMANQGLMAAGEAWQKNNESLVESNQAQADMQEQLAELSELIEPVFTRLTQAVTALLTWFNSLDDGTQTAILGFVGLVAVVGPLVSSIGPLINSISGLSGAMSGMGGIMQLLTSNWIVALIAAIVALVVLVASKGDEIQGLLGKVDSYLQNIFVKDWTSVFGPVLGEALNGFFANLKNIWDSVTSLLNGVIDFVRGVFTGDWERAWRGVQEIFSGLIGSLAIIAKAPLNSVISLINGMISGINWVIRKANSISFTNPFTGEHVGFDFGEIGKIPYLAKGGVLSQGSAIVGEAGPELLTVLGNKAVVQPLTNQTTNNNLGGVTVNVYGAPGQDVHELADLVADEIETRVQQKGAVFA